jgi:IS30 family transposase
MGNYLKMSTHQQIESLLELGWAHRRIARELGVHRGTVGRYARLRRQNRPTRPPGRRRRTRIPDWMKTGQTRSPGHRRRPRLTAITSRRA